MKVHQCDRLVLSYLKRLAFFSAVCIGVSTIFVVLGPPAFAGPGFDYKVENQRAQTSHPKPILIVSTTDTLKKGTARITRSDGKTQTVKLGAMKAGSQKKIPLDPPKGSYRYRVDIEAETRDGITFSVPLNFEASWVDPIAIEVDREAVDLGSGKLPMTSNRPLEKVEVELLDKSGRSVSQQSIDMGGRYGEVMLDFEPQDADVGAMKVVAHDIDGFWASYILEPWWIDIPHAEVNFASGKATWDDSETPKLRDSLAQIRKAVKENARFRPDMRLYIAGYTDTVGGASNNLKLSRSRAKAIAAWFKSQGLKMPIYYQGFGESVLAKETADNTDEAANRRALYILGNAPPPTSTAVPKADWQRVR